MSDSRNILSGAPPYNFLSGTLRRPPDPWATSGLLEQRRVDSAPIGSVGAPGGNALAAPMGSGGQGKDPVRNILGLGSLLPGVGGDVFGPLQELRMMQQNPEMRTVANAGLFALGLLPAVPPLVALMSRKVEAPVNAMRSQRGMMGSVAPPKLDPERIAQSALPGTEAYRARVARGLMATRRGRELSGQLHGPDLKAGGYDVPPTAFSLREPDAPAVRLLVDPSEDDLRQFFRERGDLTTLRTYESGGKLFVWAAPDSIHADMASALRVDYDPRKSGILGIEDIDPDLAAERSKATRR